MILINLLPHRELARKRRKELFNIGLGASALVGGLVAGTMFLSLQAQISSQKDINQILQTDIAKFDAQIKDIAGLEAEIAALRARQQAVEDLQSDRNLPVHLLTELVRQLPDLEPVILDFWIRIWIYSEIRIWILASNPKFGFKSEFKSKSRSPTTAP